MEGMNWWPIIISGGSFLLVNVTIIIGYIKNHSKHMRESIDEIKIDIDKIYSKINTNSTDIANINGRLNSQK